MGEIGGTFFETKYGGSGERFGGGLSSNGVSPLSNHAQERRVQTSTVLGDLKDKRIQSAGKVPSQKSLITFQKPAP